MARRSKRRKRRRRGGGKGSWALVGLGSAAVVAGVYAVGRRSESRRRSTPRPPVLPPPPELPAPRRLAGPAGELAVLDGGAGRLPVLFLHGLGGRASQWAAQLTHLWGQRRAAAFDLRGHGESAPPADGAYGIEEMARDVGAVADGLGLERFLLVGHSLGATVAAAYAAAHRRRVAALLLADPNGDQTRMPASEVRSFLDAVAADPAGEMRWYFRQVLSEARPQVAEAVLGALEATPEAALVGALESVARRSPVADLKRYGGPVRTLITPLNSLPVSLHRLLPSLSVRRVLGTSHWLMMDDPDELNRLLDEYLTTVEALG